MSRPFQIYQISRGAIGALEQAEGVGGAAGFVGVFRMEFGEDFLAVSADDAVVENLTAMPEVEIVGCRFTLTPTRGLLLTTGRKAMIADNTFLNIPMPSIYISDDARSWYESGAVDGVTIVRNRFINCASPVIGIDPENDVYKGPVHRGIVIEDNTFEWDEAYRSAHPDFTPTLISAEAVDGIIIRRNSCNIPCNPTELKNCTRIVCP